MFPTNLTTTAPFIANSTKNQTSADQEKASEYYLLVVQVTCLSAISIVGTFANLMICSAAIRRRRKSSEYFILNLAIADLMVCVIGIPLDIYQKLHAGAWQYGAPLCKVVYPFQTLLVLISIFTLTAMSLERYRAIVTPFKQKLRKSAILGIIALIWCLGLGVVVPFSNVLTYIGVSCVEKWPGKNDSKYYTIALFVIDYCVPLTIIAYCYSRAGWELTKKFKEFNVNSFDRRQTSKKQDLAVKKRLQRNKRVIKVFSFAVLMFVVCMLPGDCYWMWTSFGDDSSFKFKDDLQTFINILVYSNSAINPFIFGACQGACTQRRKMILRNQFSTTSEKIVTREKKWIHRMTRKDKEKIRESYV